METNEEKKTQESAPVQLVPTEEVTVVATEYVASESLGVITKAEIDMQISTAKAYPRSLTDFKRKAMSMATYSEDIAISCSYTLPRGGKVLEGKSVRLAEIVCAAYGNIRSGARVVANDGKTITAQGYCHDLESNNFLAVEVKRSIMQNEYVYKDGKSHKTGKRVTMNEDMQVVTGNAACAIAYRNAVFKVIPSALSDDIYDSAKEVARGTAETLLIRRDKAIAYFVSKDVTIEQLCKVLNIKNAEDIDLDKLAILNGIKATVKNGESSLADIFSPTSATTPAEKKDALKAKKDQDKKDGKTQTPTLL